MAANPERLTRSDIHWTICACGHIAQDHDKNQACHLCGCTKYTGHPILAKAPAETQAETQTETPEQMTADIAMTQLFEYLDMVERCVDSDQTEQALFAVRQVRAWAGQLEQILDRIRAVVNTDKEDTSAAQVP